MFKSKKERSCRRCKEFARKQTKQLTQKMINFSQFTKNNLSHFGSYKKMESLVESGFNPNRNKFMGTSIEMISSETHNKNSLDSFRSTKLQKLKNKRASYIPKSEIKFKSEDEKEKSTKTENNPSTQSADQHKQALLSKKQTTLDIKSRAPTQLASQVSNQNPDLLSSMQTEEKMLHRFKSLESKSSDQSHNNKDRLFSSHLTRVKIPSCSK